MRRNLPVLAVAVALGGCSGSVVSAPRVAAPVMFGPVERVGGTLVRADAEGEELNATSSSGYCFFTAGGGSGSRWDSKAEPVTELLTRVTHASDAADVRVIRIVAGGWVFNVPGGLWSENSGTLSAKLVRVKR
jgi:hypothetical protein